MATHLSLRLPWHDRGWDGHVCDNPTANVFCCGEYGLMAHEIRQGKDAAQEEAVKGMPVHLLKPDSYRPPCLRTIQGFGGTRYLKFEQRPKEFLHTKEVEIPPVWEEIAPSTAGTWPYDRVFRRAEEGDDGRPPEFLERYSPEEAVRNIKSFFGAIEPKRSLVFFYLNYDNPLNSERRRYVLVGAADVDEVSPQQVWERIDERRARIYGNLVWNRFITHGYDDARGARLPYERYLQKSLDTTDLVVEVADELSLHFKYVCRAFTDDEAAILLRELAAGLERGKAAGAVTWDWDRQISWVNSALERVLRERGPFPGIAAVLEALSFPRAVLYVDQFIRAKGVKNARQHVLDRLQNPALAETSEAAKGYETATRTLRVLPDAVGRVLLDRLCLFELTSQQVKVIAGGGLVPDEDRAKNGITSSATAILENPYLITEEYDPVDPGNVIAFHRIDQGIYYGKASAGGTIPDLETYAPDDRRRIRAAAMRCLRNARSDGHSYLLQDGLLRAVSRMRLPTLPESLGPVVIARDLEFHEERLTLLKDESFTGWMLKTTAEDEELIRGRFGKLQSRNPINLPAIDWRALATPGSGSQLSGPMSELVRDSQAEILGRLATQAFSVLTGGAGTGKTTVLATLIKGLAGAGVKEKFTLLTPTGKAAVRLKRKIKEVAGVDLEPRTIHSYLHGSWMDEDTFSLLREGDPIADGTTTVVIDECSMLDTSLLATAIRAIDWRTVRRLILSGDPQQLPPIGAGAPFKNLVDFLSAAAPNLRPCSLRINCRQLQSDSTALRLAEQFTPISSKVFADELLEQIRASGRVGVDLEVRYFKDEKDLPGTLEKLVGDAVEELLRLEGSSTTFSPSPWAAFDELHKFGEDISTMRLDAFEVLSPYRGNFFGVDALNLQLQKLLREKLLRHPGTRKIGTPVGRRFVAPDKVLQTRNCRIKSRDGLATVQGKAVPFFVANGELGRIMTVDKSGDETAAWIRYETDPRVSVRVDESWAQNWLDLGYAMTVHKSQGSDFGGVVVVIPREARQRLVSRELLYTALTRFTRRLYLLVQGTEGDPEALLSCLWRGSSEYLRRNTCLYAPKHAVPDLDEYRPEKRVVRTLRNELVASKSEALIANMLLQAKVLYYYERPLVAPDGTLRRPDFTIPVETPDGPSELYWEHWGMKGDPEYDKSVQRRKEWYAKHQLHDRLIETDEIGGFDSRAIEKIIRERILA